MAMVTSPLYTNGCDENFYTRKASGPKLIFIRFVRIEFTVLTTMFDSSLNIILTAPCFVSERRGIKRNVNPYFVYLCKL